MNKEERGKEKTAQVILTCALTLFSQKGFDNVGVQEVVEKAGVAKPCLYYYYKSKEGLLEAIKNSYAYPFVERLKSIVYGYKRQEEGVTNANFSTVLGSIIKSYIKEKEANSAFVALHLNLTYAPPSSKMYNIYAEVTRKIEGLLLDLFTHAATLFGNMKGKEALYSTIFLGITEKIVRMAEESIKEDRVIEQVLHSFLYGISS